MHIYPHFSAAARKLAQQSLETAFAPGTWTKAKHRYERMPSSLNGNLALYRSDEGAWGVAHTRFNWAAQTELFLSRMAALAGMPVAPVFVLDHEKNAPLISIIPFQNVIRMNEVTHAGTAAYLKHYASLLPFLLGFGQDMDRKGANLCMNADNKNVFGEFDFEKTDLASAFSVGAIDASQLNERLGRINGIVREQTIFYGVMERPLTEDLRRYPILRKRFRKSLERLNRISGESIYNVIDIVHSARPINKQQRKDLEFRLNMRLMRLNNEFPEAFGKLVVNSVEDKALPSERQLARHTYSFQ